MRVPAEAPLQVGVQEAIKYMIVEQNLQPGDQLPTEPELMAKFGVGRSTLREAMANMEAMGVLNRVQGRGTFVRRPPIVLANGIDELRSVSEHIRAVGAVPSTSRMQVDSVLANEVIAEKLQVDEGTPVLRVERIRRANDVVAAYCIDFVPKLLMPDPDQTDFKASLFDMFSQIGREVSYTDSAIRPAMLSRRELPELDSEVGLFLLFEEVVFDDAGVPVCFAEDYYSAEVFDFKIMRKR